MGKYSFFILLGVLAIGIFVYLKGQQSQSIKPGSNIPEQLIWTPAKDIMILEDSNSIASNKQAAVVRLWRAGHESAPEWTAKLLQTLPATEKKSFLIRLFEAGTETSSELGLQLIDKSIGPLDDKNLERMRLIKRFTISPSDTLPVLETLLSKEPPSSQAYVDIALTIYRSTQQQRSIRENFVKQIDPATNKTKIEATDLLKIYRTLIQDPATQSDALQKAKKTVLSATAPERLKVALFKILEQRKSSLSHAELEKFFDSLSNESKAKFARNLVYRCEGDRYEWLDKMSSSPVETIMYAAQVAKDEIKKADPCKR